MYFIPKEPIVGRKRRISLEKLKLTNPQRLSVAQLLTSQKNKYKKLLHETHERLHTIADLTTSLEVWYNVSGHYEHISPSCEKITGYKREDFLHRAITLERLIHPDSLEQFLSDRKKSMAAEPGDEHEYKFIRKDGEVRWALASWTPIFTRKGKHIGIRVSIMDISLQKKYEIEARNYRKLSMRLAECSENTAVITLDGEGHVESWDKTAEKLTGHKAKEMIGKLFIDIHQHSKQASKNLIELPENDFNSCYNDTIKTRSGKTLEARIMVTGIPELDGTVKEILCFLTPLKA